MAEPMPTETTATAPPPARPWPVMTLAQAHAAMTQPGSPFEIATATIRGIPTRIWKNAPPTLREVFLAGRMHGDKPFPVYQDERASFEGFARATLALAHELQALGVVKGDRVALAMRNLPEWPVVFYAAVLVGAIATPLNAWGTGAELLYGWVRTGDLARIDDEGFLYIVDRKKDMLIRGGENIYCAEVEAVLYRHPAVMDAGVVGLPHHTLGEEPAALVTLKPGAHADEAELRAFVGERLAAFKVPVRVLVLREALPRNPAGKLLKTDLKRLIAETIAVSSPTSPNHP